MISRLPVTPLGWAALVGAASGYLIGWWLGWIEFVALGIGCLLALLIAVPFVLGGHNLKLHRTLDPERVPAGDEARSVLRVTNTGTSHSPARVISDSIAGGTHLVEVPALASGLSIDHQRKLPTSRRGVIDVGPADITKSDPLGLLRRSFGGTGVSQLWVHPRYTALAPLESGFVKDLEGPTHDASPAGDVAFHAVRDYSPGDDVRHIHWMSTARTGSLMVRHYVDNRRPYLAILVDDHRAALSADEFEIALEVAASHVVSAAIDGRPVAVWVGSQQIVSQTAPADTNTALDRLCRSEQRADPLDAEATYNHMRQIDQDSSAFVFVTGAKSAHDLLPLTMQASRDVGVVVARCMSPASTDERTGIALPNATVFDFADLKAFSAHWRGIVR